MIDEGAKVTIAYEGMLEDGTVIDSSERQGMLFEFKVGEGKLPAPLENELIGMKKGEEKVVTLRPRDAYGDYDSRLVVPISMSRVRKAGGRVQPERGMTVEVTLDGGLKRSGRVAGVTRDQVLIDLNHPLAGKVLFLKVKVMDVAASSHSPS
jgi:peptidylprolyl isomerase